MIKRITETNKVDPIDYFQTVQMLKGDSGELEVSSVAYTFSLITTPNDKEVWSQNENHEIIRTITHNLKLTKSQ